METPDTTPVQVDGGDVDMVDEPVFKNQGIILSEPTEIRKQTVSFYSKLYSSEWSVEQVVEDSFLVGLPKLSEQAARELDRELSLEELHEALQSMENGRASGIDGLPAEFYKAFWAGHAGCPTRQCMERKRNKGCGTLHWLLEEPLIHGGCLDISGVTAPALSRALISSRVVTLRELLNIAGTELSRAEDLAARFGLRSLCVVNQLLRRWRTVLTLKERVQLMGYQITETNPAEEVSFPQLDIAPDLGVSEGPLLECWGVREMDFGSIPVCDAVPSKGPKITGIQYGFPALTLAHRDLLSQIL
ncbi:hypothetical protein QTP86_001706 [Hemibagrus guttatus]|nr:hypothetical protein QTP86_001706 [Hemibagrus guttatus]